MAWASAEDGRFVSALQRVLGATTGQVVAGSSIAVALPALPAAVLGVPLGIAVYRVLDRGSAQLTPPAWQLVAVVLTTVVVVAGITTVPTRLIARRPPARTLQVR